MSQRDINFLEKLVLIRYDGIEIQFNGNDTSSIAHMWYQKLFSTISYSQPSFDEYIESAYATILDLPQRPVDFYNDTTTPLETKLTQSRNYRFFHEQITPKLEDIRARYAKGLLNSDNCSHSDVFNDAEKGFAEKIILAEHLYQLGHDARNGRYSIDFSPPAISNSYEQSTISFRMYLSMGGVIRSQGGFENLAELAYNILDISHNYEEAIAWISEKHSKIVEQKTAYLTQRGLRN
jgi:hypothetical protein